MRIALVTHFFPSHGGGVEIVAGRLAQELAKRPGWQIQWFAGNCDTTPRVPGVEPLPLACWNGLERQTGVPYPLWSPSAVRRLWRGVKDADVVHIHDFAYFGSLMAALAAASLRVPLLVTQHTGAVRTRSRILGGLYSILESIFAWRCFNSAAAVAFVGDTSRRYFQRNGRQAAHFTTVWNGLDVDRYKPIEPSERLVARRAMDLDPTRKVVLFAGRCVPKKGIHIVEAVARALPDVQFLIAGAGAVDAGKWGLQNVRVLGFVGNDAMPGLYQLADALILPSYSEGFPLVVQEALACGSAVLSTDEVAGACPPIADLLHALPVPTSDDPVPWVEAMDVVLKSGADRDERALRAERARSLWSWERCADAYADLFEKVTSR